MRRTHLAALVIAALMLSCVHAIARVDVHVAIPAPPSIVIEAPPRLVVVPGVPTVHYAPDLHYNYFEYGGRYYSYHEGAWFASSTYGGPWTYVERVSVPRPVLGVPVRYYRVPPHDHHHGHGNGRGHEHHHHRD